MIHGYIKREIHETLTGLYRLECPLSINETRAYKLFETRTQVSRLEIFNFRLYKNRTPWSSNWGHSVRTFPFSRWDTSYIRQELLEIRTRVSRLEHSLSDHETRLYKQRTLTFSLGLSVRTFAFPRWDTFYMRWEHLEIRNLVSRLERSLSDHETRLYKERKSWDSNWVLLVWISAFEQ